MKTGKTRYASTMATITHSSTLPQEVLACARCAFLATGAAPARERVVGGVVVVMRGPIRRPVPLRANG
jgi:hypothetical protein